MPSEKYILVNHKPALCADLIRWAHWFEKFENRIVKQETIGDVQISTIFLGLDHNWGTGPPILFETMIFNGEHDQYQERCSTWEQAEAMHEAARILVLDSNQPAIQEPE